MDIRRYFGANVGKSALTELRASQGSPKRTDGRSQIAREKPSKKPLTADIMLSDASDDENPLPRFLRKELHKKRAKKRILLSSDDDDDLPPSVSQVRPPKRGEKITLKEVESKSTESLLKRTSHTASDEELDKREDMDGFVPAPPTKKKRRRTPSNQEKLDFSRLDAIRKKDSQKKTKTNLAPELEAINPAEFFRNFGRISTERKKGTEQSGSAIRKTNSSEKNVQVTISPQTSPRKSKRETASENKKGRKTVGLNDENCKSSQPSTRSSKTKKSPESASVKSTTVKKGIAILKKEGQMEVTKKRKENHEIGRKVDINDGTDKTMTTDIIREKEVPRSGKNARKPEQKSSKVTKALDRETSMLDELAKTKSSAREEAYLPWVDKYKPSNIKHLIGQNGEKSPMNKLLGWLRNWAKNHLGVSGKQKKARPPPWLAQSDGTAFKAVMLSGPPGVGKTTCAILACKELKLRYVEKNASDVRNKKVLEAQTSEVIGCEQIDHYVKGSITREMNTSSEITHVLIMDEVDGMSGNDDRAGIGELIQMIKETLIPIICICNDRQSQKMRSLVNYCFDVRFQRPRAEQIRARLLTIACQERLKVDKETIDEIIEASQHDVRQSIYNLHLLCLGKNGVEMQSKDAAINPFEAARRLLNVDTEMWEKQRMFFVDPSIMPLFVQENYPFVQSSKMSTSERLCALRKAANSISEGDIIDRIIRTTGAWTLLNEQALFSSVAPTSYMNGHMKGVINFPSWLGKNSTFIRRQRLLRQLATHTYLRTFAAVFPMVLDYVPVLRHNYCRPLLDKENDGVNDVMNLYKEYNLVRDDIESVAELAVWPGLTDPGAAIPIRVKAALTRTLNKEHIILPYAMDNLIKGRKKLGGGLDLNLEVDEEGNLIEQIGDENDLEDSGGESNNDDTFAGVILKKGNSANENKKTRGGKVEHVDGRGARAVRRATGRGRGNKK